MGENMRAKATPTMSATIVTLRELGWQPSSPTVWNSDDGGRRVDVGGCKITRQVAMREMSETAVDLMWANVTPHEAKGGLDQGRPDLIRTTRVHEKLLAQRQNNQAQVIEAIVVHIAWNVSRATSDPSLCKCPRCGHHTETLLHRYWEVPENAKINHRNITST